MKLSLQTSLSAIVLAVASLSMAPAAMAATKNVVGVVNTIKVAADGKSAEVTLKAGDGSNVNVRIEDQETLDKFKDKRIQKGDEVRTRFDDGDGKNLSKSFKRTSGC
ncbi:MAG: hypothetical protein RLZZ397_147 [Pseudomonadota bacterium]|jgi:hypothetical protein